MNLSNGLGDLFDDMDEWLYVNKTPLEVWLDERFAFFREWLNSLRDAGFHYLFVDFLMWAIIFVFAAILTAIFMTLLFGVIKIIKLIRDDHFERKYRRPLALKAGLQRTRILLTKPVDRSTIVRREVTAIPLKKTDKPVSKPKEKAKSRASNDIEAPPINPVLQAHLRKVLKDDSDNLVVLQAHLEEILSPGSEHFEYLDETTETEIKKLIATLKEPQEDKSSALQIAEPV